MRRRSFEHGVAIAEFDLLESIIHLANIKSFL